MYIYIYIYIHINTQTHTFIYTRIHARAHTHTHTHTEAPLRNPAAHLCGIRLRLRGQPPPRHVLLAPRLRGSRLSTGRNDKVDQTHFLGFI